MRKFDIRNLTRDYEQLVDEVARGAYVAPRGVETYEIRDAVLVFEDAHSATLPVGIGRGVSKDLCVAELCQWAGGVSDLMQLRSVSNDKFLRYSDDGTRLHGAYGPRAHRGLRRAVQTLADDPDSRQAVVPIWTLDEPLKTKDLPCTVSWSFLIRDGKLHMTTLMRSNDVWTGVAYDVPIMARIQSAVAWALGVELGSYTHHAQSLHVYATDLEETGSLHRHDGVAIDDVPFFDELHVGPVAWDPVEKWEWLSRQFVAATRGGEYAGPDELEWCAERLADSDRYDHLCVKCRYFLPQPELICP